MDGYDANSTSYTWHKKFNTQEGDVVVQSSDNVTFRLNRKCIDAYAGKFPREATTVIDNLAVIKVEEPANVLEMIFEYFQPQRYPDLENMGFEDLTALAIAIEKYEVFPAMQICVARMRSFVKDYPLYILGHGIAYNYPILIDEAAPFTVLCDIVTVAEGLASDALVPWLKYRATIRSYIFDATKSTLALSINSSGANDKAPCKIVKLSNGKSSFTIRSDCFTAIMAWIGHIEGLSTLQSLEEELSARKYLIKRLCKDNTQCHWLSYVLQRCEVSLKNISKIGFTSFLFEDEA